MCKTITRHKREKLLQKAQYSCEACGRSANGPNGICFNKFGSPCLYTVKWNKRNGFVGEYSKKIILTIDHIFPQSRGGTFHRDNMIILCSDCNCYKGSIDPKIWVQTLPSLARKNLVPKIKIAEAIFSLNRGVG